MSMRMTGLVSGMDTESMVKELVQASSAKVDNIKKEKQLLQWKKEAWQGLNTKLYDFFKTEVSNMRLPSSFKSKVAKSSDESKVSIKAGSGAPNGAHSVSVKQLASSAYLTGANIKKNGGTYDTYSSAGSSVNFADMLDSDGNTSDLVGKTITVSNADNTKSITFELGGTGDNGVANIDELNKKLSESEDFAKLSAGIEDGKLVFTNNSEKKDKDGVITGSAYNIKSADLGLDAKLDYSKDDAGNKPTLSANTDLRVKSTFSSADITSGTKLADIGIAVGTSFSIKGKDFVVDKDSKISDFTDALSKMGVTANFDANQGRFYINASSTGAEYDFDITSSDSNALDILGLSRAAGATKTDAQDAIIEYNGVEYTGNSNTFELNGLTITAKGVTGTYDKTTGVFTNNTAVNVEIGADTEGVYNTIKNFVKKYNELIDEMNTLYNEKKPEYEPLTDEEKTKLSDNQIEQWEKKAKTGLLRRDDTINNLLSSMREILNKGIKVTDKDGNEATYTLASLGIVTGDYSEKGKLHILGDKDDPLYASEENKLMNTLNEKPEILSQIFVGDKDNVGIGQSLYSSLSKAMARNEASHSLTFYNDITMDNEIKEKDSEVDKMNEKLSKLEDKYYEQFAAMEKAMAKLQQQQSYLSSLMGTA